MNLLRAWVITDAPAYPLASVIDPLGAGGLNQIHRPHRAQLMGVAHQFSAGSLQADLPAVAPHPSSLIFSFLCPGSARVTVVVDAVVVLAQHGEV